MKTIKNNKQMKKIKNNKQMKKIKNSKLYYFITAITFILASCSTDTIQQDLISDYEFLSFSLS